MPAVRMGKWLRYSKNDNRLTQQVHITSDLLRKSVNGDILEYLCTLENLVVSLSNLETTDKRDYVYSLVALASDTNVSHQIMVSPSTRVGSTLKITRKRPAETHIENDRSLRRSTEIPHTLSEREKYLARMVRDQIFLRLVRHRQGRVWGKDARGYVFQSKSLQTTPRPLAIAKEFISHLQYLVAKRSYPIDYTKPLYEVCVDFMSFAIKTSQSLDILCRPWAPFDNINKLPYWIPTLTQQSFGKVNGELVRINADPLVGIERTSRRWYHASGTLPLPPYKLVGASLIVRGFILDTIGSLSREKAMFGNIPFSWLAFSGWDDTSQRAPDNFWRTLVADRGPNGMNVPSFYRRMCSKWSENIASRADINIEGFIMHPSTGSHEKEFLKRVQAVIWNKRLTTTSQYGQLGLVPEQCDPGDLVCILYGCSVPCVLRKLPYSEVEYRFIGECFVYGMMDGEALKTEQAAKDQSFELL